jgi:hypothetical protein
VVILSLSRKPELLEQTARGTSFEKSSYPSMLLSGYNNGQECILSICISTTHDCKVFFRWFVPRIRFFQMQGIFHKPFHYQAHAASPLFERFQVLTAVSMKFRFVFWDVLPSKIIVDRRFRGTFCLWNDGRKLFYMAVHPRRQIWTSLLFSTMAIRTYPPILPLILTIKHKKRRGVVQPCLL